MNASHVTRQIVGTVMAGLLLSAALPHLRAQQTTPVPASDPRSFFQDMLLAGLTEVQIARLAADKASNPDVRNFARMVTRDAAEANSRIAVTASSLHISLQTELDALQKASIERLTGLQGADFDREFLLLVVRSHEDHVWRLGAMAAGGVSMKATPQSLAPNEPEAALWASHMLPVAQHHLRLARELQQKTQ
jgi:putative membrane protein